MLPDGWHYDVPMEQYLADPAFSSSDSVKLDKTPLTFHHDRGRKREPTAAMIEGTALHEAVLEPALFHGHYIVLGTCEAIKKGDGERCTNPGVVYRDGQSYCGVKGHDPYGGPKITPMEPGIHVLTEDAFARLVLAKASVLTHAEAKKFFHGQGFSEVTGIYTDPATGVRMKIRLDRDIKRVALHTDLKYTADITDAGFKRQAVRMGWVQRSAFYRRVMAALDRPAVGSVIVAVESGAPHDCRTFLLDEGDIAAFDKKIDGLLATYAECSATGVWPGYPQVLTPLWLNSWDLPQQVRPDDTLEDEG